ncbi:MAG: hypothetical protein VXZ82_23505 [Planctomycetota bacterium]|nr:hypothetical protein [Planctomycetota bacterium]
MAFVVGMLIKTAAVPIVVAVVVTWLLHRLERLKPQATTLGVACGFIAGWFFQEFSVWFPVRYLDWFPAAALILALLPKVSPIAAAWFLVPAFPKMVPPRLWAVGLLTVFTYGLAWFLNKATDKIQQRALVGVFMATGTACSLVLLQSFSLKFAQIAGLLTASLTAALLFANKPGGNAKGLPFLFFGLMCNLMFIGYANTSSDVPTWCFALPLVAPLVLLWNPSSRKLQAVRYSLVVTILMVAVIPALLVHPPWEAEH